MIAVAYIRVSKEREDMITHDTQLDKIKQYCRLHNIDLVKVYQDIDYSGRSTNRPEFQLLFSELHNIEPDYLIVYKLDRFVRSVKDFHQHIEKLENSNVSLVSITQNIDMSTPMGRLLRNVLIDFAQFESEMTGERVKDNMIHNAQNGRWNGGNVPYGYQWDEENKLLVPDSVQSEVIKFIFSEYIKGNGSTTIVDILRMRHISSPTGGAEWDRTTITYIIRNPLYKGYIQYDDKVYEGQHEGIVSSEVFNKANKVLQEYSDSKKSGNTYILSGLTECGLCGNSGFNTFYGSGKYRSRRYVCSTRYKDQSCSMNAYDAESLECKVVNCVLSLGNSHQFFEKLKAEKNKKGELSFLKQKETQLLKKISKLDKITGKLFADHYEKEIISNEQFEEYSAKYHQQKKILTSELEDIQLAINDNEMREQNIEFIYDSINQLQLDWNLLDAKEKNLALKQVIDKVVLYKNKVEIDIIYGIITIDNISKKRTVLYC